MTVDSKVGVVVLAGGLFLLFPIFNTLNTEQYSMADPPQMDPPDNLPDMPPPDVKVDAPLPVPPCVNTDRKVTMRWPETPSTGDAMQNLPAQAREATVYVNHSFHIGQARIELANPNGTTVWTHERDYMQQLAQPSAPYSYTVPLGEAGEWTLAWDVTANEGGYVTFNAIIHIRCDAPEGGSGGGTA